MKISVPDILARSPKKLLKHYPRLMRELKARKEAKAANVKAEFIPRLPIIVIEGSRLGGKSQYAIRTGISSILDGYATSMMLCTITEDGSKDTSKLIDDILEQAEESVIKSRESDRPIRILSNGEPIFIEYLNKQDGKARQTKADVLILEELEKWNEKSGNSSLYTMIRHFDLIIVLSNQLPRWAKVFFDTFGAEYDRIDYWENEALEPSIKEALDRKKVADPEGWARDVMYVPTDGKDRVFSERLIDNAFAIKNINYNPIISVLSIDPSAGGADSSSIFRVDMDSQGVMEAHLLLDESMSPENLCQRIARMKVDERADEEIWDANGIGLVIMQDRSPKEEWANRGIVPFVGKATKPQEFFNARAEAYYLTADALSRNALKVFGLTIEQQEQLILEMRATVYKGDREDTRTNTNDYRLEKKAKIKEALGGLSPNKLDAIVMGVWRLLTYHKNNNRLYKNDNFKNNVNISGVPGL